MLISISLKRQKARKARDSQRIREQFSELQTVWRGDRHLNSQPLLKNRNVSISSSELRASCRIRREDRLCPVSPLIWSSLGRLEAVADQLSYADFSVLIWLPRVFPVAPLPHPRLTEANFGITTQPCNHSDQTEACPEVERMALQEARAGKIPTYEVLSTRLCLPILFRFQPFHTCLLIFGRPWNPVSASSSWEPGSGDRFSTKTASPCRMRSNLPLKWRPFRD